MTYNIITIGCQMNRADSERLSFYLQEIGFKNESNFLKADLVILVTCGVKQAAEDRVYGLVGQILKKNKKSVVAITGCLSDRSDVRRRLPKVKIWFNISDFIGLQKNLKKYFIGIKKISENRIKKYLNIPADYSSNFSAFVPIGNGCNNFCSYCVVPYARGREVYRPSKDIIKEVRCFTDGCQPTNACAVLAASMAAGKPVLEALKISAGDIIERLGDLPDNHRHCSILAVSTLYRAIAEYLVN